MSAGQKTFRQRVVHWFRFRFDIGYRCRLEIDAWQRRRAEAAENARHAHKYTKIVRIGGQAVRVNRRA